MQNILYVSLLLSLVAWCVGSFKDGNWFLAGTQVLTIFYVLGEFARENRERSTRT